MPPRPQPRRGAVAVLVAIILAVLLGISALVVDLGYATSVQAQLQGAADAGAHAGALQLDGTEVGVAAAPVAADDVAGFNRAGDRAVDLDPATDVTLGVWDPTVRTFTSGGAVEDVNAVRVVARRVDLPAWFARAAFGTPSIAASAEAVAFRSLTGAGSTECFMPFAVPSCVVDDVYGVDGINYVDLVLNPPGVNNAAWARPGDHPNASWIRDQLYDCEYDGEVSVGETVGVNNGLIASALTDLVGEVEASPTLWQESLWGPLPPQATNSGIAPSLYGRTLEGTVMLFQDDGFCTSPGSLTGYFEIDGLVHAAIYDVVDKGPAASRTIKMRLETMNDYDVGSGAGGPDYGVVYRHISLVQ